MTKRLYSFLVAEVVLLLLLVLLIVSEYSTITMAVYYLSLINACISIALYELILLIRYAFKKK